MIQSSVKLRTFAHEGMKWLVVDSVRGDCRRLKPRGFDWLSLNGLLQIIGPGLTDVFFDVLNHQAGYIFTGGSFDTFQTWRRIDFHDQRTAIGT